MTFVTLEIGPTWKMELLRGLLEARGVPAIVQEDDLSGFWGLPSKARLQVLDVEVETARTAVVEAQRDGDQALARLRFGAHERFREPRPIRDLVWDVTFWLVLILGMAWIVKSLLVS